MRYTAAFTFLMLAIGLVNADTTKTLHVATWPAHAEVFVDSPPTPGHAPAPTTPYSLAVPSDSDWVHLYFFRPGYADTALDVRIPRGTDSYLLVHLQAEADPLVLEEQGDFLATRNRHRWGYRLLWGSLFPAALSLGFASMAAWQYREAQASAERMDASTLVDGDSYRDAQHEYDQSLTAANRNLSRARWSLGAGALLLATGFVLTF